jgi:hypothetical protein
MCPEFQKLVLKRSNAFSFSSQEQSNYSSFSSSSIVSHAFVWSLTSLTSIPNSSSTSAHYLSRPYSFAVIVGVAPLLLMAYKFTPSKIATSKSCLGSRNSLLHLSQSQIAIINVSAWISALSLDPVRAWKFLSKHPISALRIQWRMLLFCSFKHVISAPKTDEEYCFCRLLQICLRQDIDRRLQVKAMRALKRSSEPRNLRI